MLVVPHVGQLSWKNPPVITITLILINILIFVMFQSDEGQYYQEASEYYYNSGLARIEADAYLDYLNQNSRDQELAALHKFNPEKRGGLENILAMMWDDKPFVKKLENDEIITPEMEIYRKWKERRDHIDEVMSLSTTQRYGYKPAENQLLTAFTCMFLHGGPMHLIGNMIFLWLVGCMIELSCGKAIYLATYLVTGIIATLSFGMIYSDSTVPLIGASGAISGLMGFYTILFARKKVAVFLSLGFYFTNTRVPAIILLPFWIGKEIYQIFLGA
jgi:membrane associated rhomboid family serine protease